MSAWALELASHFAIDAHTYGIIQEMCAAPSSLAGG